MSLGNPNALRFIKQVLYKLKLDYGFPVDVYRTVQLSIDHKTGKRIVTKQKYPIDLGIVLPSILARKFSYDLSFIAANKNFTYGGNYDMNLRLMILEAEDLPEGFEFSIETDYVVFEKKRYELREAQLMEDQAGYLITMKETVGTKAGEILEESVSSHFRLSQSAVGVL